IVLGINRGKKYSMALFQTKQYQTIAHPGALGTPTLKLKGHTRTHAIIHVKNNFYGMQDVGVKRVGISTMFLAFSKDLLELLAQIRPVANYYYYLLLKFDEKKGFVSHFRSLYLAVASIDPILQIEK
ncbi:hypothetical protein ACJX0J_036901, partial [Zea mays]